MRLVVTKILSAIQKGDLAIALSQLGAIRQRFPEAKITTFIRRPELDRHWFSDADRVASELFPVSPKLSSGKRLVRLMSCIYGDYYDSTTRSFYQACKEADLVIFCGGGSPGGYGWRNLIRNAWCPVLLARRAGVPIYFSALSVEPMGTWLSRSVTAWALNQASFITLREVFSTKTLAELGVKTDYEVTADWAILLHPAGTAEAKSILREEGVPFQRRQFGINLRDIRAVNPEGDADRIDTPYLDNMKQLVKRVIGDMDADLVIFSMSCPPASNDLAFADQVVAKLPGVIRKHVYLVRGDYTPSQLKGMMGQMEMFIGTRLHPSIFAITSSVPTLTIHDHLKVEGFMKLAGMDDWHVSARRFSIDTVMKKIRVMFDQRTSMVQQLKNQQGRLIERATANLLPIEQIARGFSRPDRRQDAVRGGVPSPFIKKSIAS